MDFIESLYNFILYYTMEAKFMCCM